MAQMSPRHTHKFSIADKDAVRILLTKVGAPTGSRSVGVDKLLQALGRAARQYDHARQEVGRAFFHGLLTGYAVGLKHK